VNLGRGLHEWHLAGSHDIMSAASHVNIWARYILVSYNVVILIEK